MGSQEQRERKKKRAAAFLPTRGKEAAQLRRIPSPCPVFEPQPDSKYINKGV